MMKFRNIHSKDVYILDHIEATADQDGVVFYVYEFTDGSRWDKKLVDEHLKLIESDFCIFEDKNEQT